VTGKTTYLTQMVEHAAAAIGGGSVLVSSFTKAAAEVVTSRSPSIPPDNIGTLHRFCFEAIGRMPVVEEKKAYIQEWNEFAPAYAMSMPGCKDMNSGLETPDGAMLGDKLLAQTTILRNKMIPDDQWPTATRAFQTQWKSWKAAVGGIDYTDMLEMALADCSQAPSHPRIIFVDEAQDCTALQFAVLRRWAQKTDRLVMVGDDDQCIYQFAGATPEAFAIGEIGPGDRLLDQSYRVPYNVWEHATSWIAKIANRVEKPYSPRHDPDPGFVKRAPVTYKQGPQIAELIMKSLAKYDSVMVVGSCSYMLEPTKKALIEAGLPFHNPYRLIRADWNPLRLATGTTYAQRVTAFLRPQADGKAWTATEIKEWGDVLQAEGVFNRGFKKKFHEEEYAATPAYRVLLDFFTPEAMERALAFDLNWWTDNLVNEAAERKAAYPLKVVEQWGASFLDAAEIPPSVTLGTIHSVKGGEADVVIVIPDLSQEGMMEWTGKGKAAIRRLMYVAVTRARQGVFICKPASPYTCNL